MKNEEWKEQQVKRASYRAVLLNDAKEEQLSHAFAECQAVLERAREEYRILTASLYRYGRFLFLYTEGIGEAAVPEELFAPAVSFLQKWPAVPEALDHERAWVLMQPYYYHALPETAEEWMQNRKPSLRRGRIALLAQDKWESYLRHHLALMREGLIEGDKYHLISIHENVLFSYFEEPKTMRNLRLEPGARSRALEEWLLTEPESHFMRFAPGQGPGSDENFVFLPCLAEV